MREGSEKREGERVEREVGGRAQKLKRDASIRILNDFVIVFNICYVCGVYDKVTDPLFLWEEREERE